MRDGRVAKPVEPSVTYRGFYFLAGVTERKIVSLPRVQPASGSPVPFDGSTSELRVESFGTQEAGLSWSNNAIIRRRFPHDASDHTAGPKFSVPKRPICRVYRLHGSFEQKRVGQHS